MLSARHLHPLLLREARRAPGAACPCCQLPARVYPGAKPTQADCPCLPLPSSPWDHKNQRGAFLAPSQQDSVASVSKTKTETHYCFQLKRYGETKKTSHAKCRQHKPIAFGQIYRGLRQMQAPRASFPLVAQAHDGGGGSLRAPGHRLHGAVR